jgi:hypothetical protein
MITEGYFKPLIGSIVYLPLEIAIKNKWIENSKTLIMNNFIRYWLINFQKCPTSSSLIISDLNFENFIIFYLVSNLILII